MSTAFGSFGVTRLQALLLTLIRVVYLPKSVTSRTKSYATASHLSFLSMMRTTSPDLTRTL